MTQDIILVDLCWIQVKYNDANARDGAEHIRKLLHKEHIEIEKPDVLLFTAPYRICKDGCTGSDRNINFAMSFPLLLGNYGKKLYKQLYPNDTRKPEHLFITKPTRGPFTTCSPNAKVTQNRSTKSTMHPGFVVGTKSTGFLGLEIRKTRSTGYHGYNEVTGTRSTAHHGYSEGAKRTRSTDHQDYRETLSTRVPDFEDYKNTWRVNFLRYKPFLTRSQDSVYPDYAEFKNTRELNVLRDKSPHENILPEVYNKAKEDGTDYSLQSEQDYTYRNSITPNSIDSHSKKMQWLKIRKTMNDMIPSKPSLMRRLAPLRREPKNYQDSIPTNLEVRERNEQSHPFIE